MLGNIWALTKKDLRIYFSTATSYALITAFAILSAYFFLALLSQYQFESMRSAQFQMDAKLNFNDMVIVPLFLNVQVFFLFLIPMITMRLLAEEQKTKTMQLLMTTPIRPLEIVLGKYFAALSVVACMLLVTLIYPIILHLFGQGDNQQSALDWVSIATNYLGMFLVGATFVGIGLFASSLTDSQIVAVVISFATLLMFWVISWAGMGKTGFWHDFTNYVSVLGHLEGFYKGNIKVADFVYYLSMIGVGLFLTYRSVDAQRWRN